MINFKLLREQLKISHLAWVLKSKFQERVFTAKSKAEKTDHYRSQNADLHRHIFRSRYIQMKYSHIFFSGASIFFFLLFYYGNCYRDNTLLISFSDDEKSFRNAKVKRFYWKRSSNVTLTSLVCYPFSNISAVISINNSVKIGKFWSVSSIRNQ